VSVCIDSFKSVFYPHKLEQIFEVSATTTSIISDCCSVDNAIFKVRPSLRQWRHWRLKQQWVNYKTRNEW